MLGDPEVVQVHGAIIYRQVVAGFIDGQDAAVAIKNRAAGCFNDVVPLNEGLGLGLPLLGLGKLKLGQTGDQGDTVALLHENKEDNDAFGRTCRLPVWTQEMEVIIGQILR